mmetsp:Transcript_4743/g.13404  ORF Transcript_4743/g.13404 Transcript_4743/m.13404 type:complete len:214 (-) Transcript_4743:459-1100(-)
MPLLLLAYHRSSNAPFDPHKKLPNLTLSDDAQPVSQWQHHNFQPFVVDDGIVERVHDPGQFPRPPILFQFPIGHTILLLLLNVRPGPAIPGVHGQSLPEDVVHQYQSPSLQQSVRTGARLDVIQQSGLVGVDENDVEGRRRTLPIPPVAAGHLLDDGEGVCRTEDLAGGASIGHGEGILLRDAIDRSSLLPPQLTRLRGRLLPRTVLRHDPQV